MSVTMNKRFLEKLFYSVQEMTWSSQNEGYAVNDKHIRRLMRLMSICQKLDTSRPAKGQKTDPYLLSGLRVERPNQVWYADTT